MLGQQFGPFINLTMKKQSDTVFNQIHKSIRIVRASDGQCQSPNSPGFHPSIHRRGGIWGAADEAALNKAHPTMEVYELPHSCLWQFRLRSCMAWQLWWLHTAAPELDKPQTVDWQLRKTVAHDKKTLICEYLVSCGWQLWKMRKRPINYKTAACRSETFENLAERKNRAVSCLIVVKKCDSCGLTEGQKATAVPWQPCLYGCSLAAASCALTAFPFKLGLGSSVKP